MANRNAPSAASGRGKKLVFMGGGGGGKTTIAMLTASTALARGRHIHLYDMDRSNQSLGRYMKDLLPPENQIDRGSVDPLLVPEFLEERVFCHDDDAIIEVGANLEDGWLLWLADRGSSKADDIRIICPVQKKDGVSAVDRIYQNTDGIKKLLVLNLGGMRKTENARESELYQQLLASGAQEACFPALTQTLDRIDRSSRRPDEMLEHGDIFDQTGALKVLRQVEEFFEPLHDFRVW